MNHYQPAEESLVTRYARDGYCFPVRVLDEAEVTRYAREAEQAWERGKAMRLGNKNQLNFPHVLFPFANELVRHPRLLDAVESIIGPDILVWGSTFFFKPPRSGGFVSWHQDLTYWGIDDNEAQVSAWIALGTVNRENGCMRFVTGSHRRGQLAHSDTWGEENILTRGQSVTVDETVQPVVDVELSPGEMSLHHGYLLHGSGPNRSDRWRLGFNVNFLAPRARQTVAPVDFAMLVRGEDRYGHFAPVDSPRADLDASALVMHGRILAAQNEALYAGAGGNEPAATTPR